MEGSQLETLFVSVFNDIADEIHETAKLKGWWESERNEGELIALVHSELSEGLEAIRKGLVSDHIPDFLGIEEEYADAIIRIMDHGKAKGYRVAEALIEKMKFNNGREYRHGGKKF